MIILDLDGVLADFTTAACEVHGHPNYVSTRWGFYEDWGITTDQFWDKIHADGDRFYDCLVKPFWWMNDLLGLIERADDYVIMSSPSNDPAGYAAKKIWCDKYIDRPVKLIVGSEKHLLAGPDRLLIDDYDENVRKFRAAGGHTLTFPQLWNGNSGAVDRRWGYVKDRLDNWKTYMNVYHEGRVG